MKTKARDASSSIDPREAAWTLELLVAVADHRSFSTAAARLGLTPSAVSKAVARAEARLGVQLVQRTTRRVSLTEVGEAYVARGRQVLADLDAVERDVAARDPAVRGSLRIAAPATYGAIRIAPLVTRFQEEHPGVTTELRCDDRLVDLVDERIDLAVRIVAQPPAEFVARPLEDDRRGLYASPSYLRRHRAPRAADELSSHAGLRYGSGSASSVVWHLGDPGGAPVLARAPAVFSSNSMLAVHEAARAGLGIGELPEYLGAPDVAAGALREVLPGSMPVLRRTFAVYLPSRYLPARVRALVDFLAKALRR